MGLVGEIETEVALPYAAWKVVASRSGMGAGIKWGYLHLTEIEEVIRFN